MSSNIVDMVSTAFLALSLAGSPAFAEGQGYHLGAWYFTMWNSAYQGMHQKHTESVYHRSDNWGGVRDFAEGHGAFPISDPKTGKPADLSARRPLAGYYDLMVQQTVDREILDAASGGLDFFAFYYYWDVAKNSESSMMAPLEKFFHSPVKSKMKFLLAPIFLGKGQLTLAQWKTVFIPRVISYMAQDSYFRVNGRPVIVDFGIHLPAGRYAEAYAELRRQIQARLHVNPLILNLLGQKNGYQDLHYRARHLQPDGFTCFNFGPSRPAEPYSEFATEWMQSMKNHFTSPQGRIDPGTVFVPCGSLGVDARPWFNIGWGPWTQWKTPDARPFITDLSPEAFRRHLSEIKTLIDSNVVGSLQMAIIYSWNEWGEGACVLSPSQAHRYQYLDVLKNVFHLTPRAERH